MIVHTWGTLFCVIQVHAQIHQTEIYGSIVIDVVMFAMVVAVNTLISTVVLTPALDRSETRFCHTASK